MDNSPSGKRVGDIAKARQAQRDDADHAHRLILAVKNNIVTAQFGRGIFCLPASECTAGGGFDAAGD